MVVLSRCEYHAIDHGLFVFFGLENQASVLVICKSRGQNFCVLLDNEDDEVIQHSGILELGEIFVLFCLTMKMMKLSNVQASWSWAKFALSFSPFLWSYSQVMIHKHPVRFFVHKRPHVDYFLEQVGCGEFTSMFSLIPFTTASMLHGHLVYAGTKTC